MEKRWTRYELQEPLIALHNGHLYKGRDLALSRQVLVFIVKLSGSYPAQEYIEELGKGGHTAWPSLLHVLDAEVTAEQVSIILPYEKGEPLIRLIEHHTLSFEQIVKLLVELGHDLQDVLERRPLDFSLRAENLWLRHDGKLNIIHSWDKGTAKERPAKELCRLFFQLVTRSSHVPENPEPFRVRLAAALAELGVQESARSILVQAAQRTMQEQTSLAAWIRSLQDALSGTGDPEVASVEETEEYEEEEPVRKRGWSSFFGKKMWIGLTAGVIGLVVFIGVFALLFETVGKMLASDERKPAVTQATPPVQENPVQEQPKPAPEPKPAPPAGDGPVQVPALKGLSKEEAEKLALSSGLKYAYFLEVNEQPAGKVFKQEPQPGETVDKGTRVTFWISKGKP
ncbi:PASTA domain-containing protein [Paenibacillus sp. GD4]|uniref:PASTA domain-containing protein n=1 Tax=Paenibacillus sp. GD4 TaxID=3068890 RepID=UPI0027967BEE|nr:PASTA domain-containing protein [Paenibacillus sp. GD4]MDQ1912831.1 PASTA domain-containing protein [Paenibacillus sp. GD4]